MINKNSRIYKGLAYFTLPERQKREYVCYQKERNALDSLSDDELRSRYINIKSKYEYKRNLFSFFLVTILVTGLMGVWDVFYNLSKQLLPHLFSVEMDVMEMAKIGFMILCIFFFAIIVIIFMVLVSYIKALYALHKQLLLIEEVRNVRQNNK